MVVITAPAALARRQDRRSIYRLAIQKRCRDSRGSSRMTENQEQMLDECLEADHGLTPKEIDYLEDLDNNWRDRDLSQKQADWLERINARINR